MSKTAKQTVDASPTADFEESTVIDQVSEFAEKGIAQSKETFDKIKDQTESAQKTLETTLDSAKTNTASPSLKALDAIRANTEASFNHLEALIGAKSVSEAIDLQTAFVRQQLTAISGQAKEFHDDATKAVEEFSAPVKSAVEKIIKDLKVA